MSFALNEVEATAKKAARGAGYSWGMAEEAAKATRWLCANGIDGAKALAAVLAAADGTGPKKMAPDDLCGDWSAKAGAMCPLMAGAALSDFAGVRGADEVRLLDVVVPVMLLPFAAMAAKQLGKAVTVDWDGVLAITDGHALSLDGAKKASLMEPGARVTVRIKGQIGQPLPHQSRAMPKDADWTVLNRFAQRTYAPSSEVSRLRGAGAGLSDND